MCVWCGIDSVVDWQLHFYLRRLSDSGCKVSSLDGDYSALPSHNGAGNGVVTNRCDVHSPKSAA